MLMSIKEYLPLLNILQSGGIPSGFCIVNKMCNLWDFQFGTLLGLTECHIRASMGSLL